MSSLRAIPLLNGVSEPEIDRLDGRCAWRNYEAGEMIIDHNETSNDVRFILAGHVRIIVRMIEGREVIFNDFGPGDFFGELAAIDNGTRSANVTALSRCQICIMPQTVFKDLCHEVPNVGWEVMRHLVDHVRRLSHRLSEFSFLKARHRLYSELLRLSRERLGAGVEGQRIISPAPLQADIADRIASRREIVSREMKELERKGLLERARGGLILLDPPRLQRMVDEGWTGA